MDAALTLNVELELGGLLANEHSRTSCPQANPTSRKTVRVGAGHVGDDYLRSADLILQSLKYVPNERALSIRSHSKPFARTAFAKP